MLKRTLLCLLVLLTVILQAHAAGIEVQTVETRIGDHVVSYPQLNGMKDEAVQQKINDDIVLSSGVTNHMITLVTLTGQQKLQVEYDACILNDRMFSTVISASGKLPGRRDGHEWTALTYDLQTGERVTLEMLFADVAAAIEHMEQIAEKSLSKELNGYMEYGDIMPLPVDSFTLDEHGITFWYPYDQFSLVSGRSGACQFWYEELRGLWLNHVQAEMTPAEQKAAVTASVAAGKVPHVPVQIGQNMQEIADAYRLLRTPDEFPGGRYFVMEHPAFREIMIISDSLQNDYAHSEAEGIQLRRGALHGLIIDSTTQSEWRAVLGEPAQNTIMTAGMAYDYGLVEGQYDTYVFGSHELRLYADNDGILNAIQVCR